MNDALLLRFLAKISIEDRGHSTPCWIWTGACTPKGYPQLYGGRRSPAGHKVPESAHRLSYQHFVGETDAPQLDHLCRQRACVNYSHLEPVTNRENTLRGTKGRLQTHCKHGHPLSGANLHVDPHGHRRCRACGRDRYHKWVTQRGRSRPSGR